MLIIFIRAIIVYCILILSVRLMGKRQIGELQPSELAITILISNIATLTLEDTSIPLIVGLIPLLTLVCLDVLMSWAGMRCGRIRTLMTGKPVVIISNGKIDRSKMYELRFTVDDLMEALRGQNIFDISEVQYAVAETTGKISVLPKFENRTVTNGDMPLTGRSSDPPVLVIEDGTVIGQNLSDAGLDRERLDKELEKRSLAVKDIYIMTAEPDSGKITIIRKNEAD